MNWLMNWRNRPLFKVTNTLFIQNFMVDIELRTWCYLWLYVEYLVDMLFLLSITLGNFRTLCA